MSARFMYYFGILSAILCCATFLSCGHDFSGKLYLSTHDGWQILAADDAADYASIALRDDFTSVSKIEHLDKRFATGIGSIWLKQDFELPAKPYGLQAVLLGAINPADKCYINGILIGESGTLPSANHHYFSDWNKVRYYTFPAEILHEGKNELLVQIFVRHEGAYDGLVRVGPASILGREATLAGVIRNHLYSLIAAVLFFIGFFYMFIFIRRPGDKDCLYYGLMCFFSVIALTNFFATDLPFDVSKFLNYLVFQKIVFCALLLVTYFFVRFNMLYFRQGAGRIPRRFFALLIAAGCVIFVIMPDARYMIKARQYVFMATILPSAFYVMAILGIALYRRQRNSLRFFIGALPFFFCTMFDIIWHNISQNYSYIYVGFLGLPAYIFSIGIILANNFINYRNQIELTNLHLDHLVEERTEALRKSKDETERALNELRVVSRQDALTGLYNRRYFMERFFEEFNRAKRYNQQLAVLMIDLDHFKKINDTCGHICGDKVLTASGSVIRTTLRQSDIAGRFGGEEFCILLPNATLEQGEAVAEKIRTGIAALRFEHQGHYFAITCSIGVTCQKQEADMNLLLHRADIALYRAKEEGRNRTICSL